jgi:hypothetical protein
MTESAEKITKGGAIGAEGAEVRQRKAGVSTSADAARINTGFSPGESLEGCLRRKVNKGRCNKE